jgi:hypothetical protein
MLAALPDCSVCVNGNTSKQIQHRLLALSRLKKGRKELFTQIHREAVISGHTFFACSFPRLLTTQIWTIKVLPFCQRLLRKVQQANTKQ